MSTSSPPSKPSLLTELKSSLSRLSEDLHRVAERLSRFEEDRQSERLAAVEAKGALELRLDRLARDVEDAANAAKNAAEAAGTVKALMDDALAPLVRRLDKAEQKLDQLWKAAVAVLGVVGLGLVSAWLGGLIGG